MNNEILINLSKITTVLLCLAAIIIIVWHNISKRIYPPHLLPLVIALLVLTLWSLLSTTIPTTLITIIALMIILVLLFSIPKQINKLKQPEFDQSQVIRSTQEQERSRIYANLHDDVGAKLLELIYSAQDANTKTIAKDILSQMRQAVAQTQNIQCTIAELIQSICDEAKLRFDACNINLSCENHITGNKYKCAGVLPSAIERICREVISNIIKHAQATDVEIIFNSQSIGFSLIISDNGMGFQANKNGKGLTTIEKRANKINAKTHWHSAPNKGTQFTLSLSL